MLVLRRKVSDKIIITAPDGTRIELTIVEVRGDATRIGIDAPKEWTVWRGELQTKIDAEREDR